MKPYTDPLELYPKDPPSSIIRQALTVRAQLLTSTYLTQSRLCKIGKRTDSTCSLCNLEEDTTEHILASCPCTLQLRNTLLVKIRNILKDFPTSAASFNASNSCQLTASILLPHDPSLPHPVNAQILKATLHFIFKLHVLILTLKPDNSQTGWLQRASVCENMEDGDLDRLAASELLLEAGRGKERASTMGAYGWKKKQISTNKVFLKNTLRGVISGNKHRSRSRVEKRHKDRLKRTELDVDCKEEDEMQRHYRGSRCDRLGEPSQEKNKRTPGHSSRRDDPHSLESYGKKTSKACIKERNPRCQIRVSDVDSSRSHTKGKD